MFTRSINHLLRFDEIHDSEKAERALRAADDEIRDILDKLEYDDQYEDVITDFEFQDPITESAPRRRSLNEQYLSDYPDSAAAPVAAAAVMPLIQHRNLVRNADQLRSSSKPFFREKGSTTFTTPLEPAATLTCLCNNCPTSTCQTDGVCFAGIEADKSSIVYRCIPFKEHFPDQTLNMHCKSTDATPVLCCNSGDFCNQNPNFFKEPGPQSGQTVFMIAMLVPFTMVLLLLAGFSIVYAKRRKQRRMVDSIEGGESEPMILPPGNIRDFMDMTTSGSGSGLPLLVQRSIARQITLLDTIGKGRFGEVWRGRWRGENVAVKIFSTRDERSWFREVEIYQTVMLRHQNLLGFIAADNKDNGTWTQLWLVTDYHELGSLFDYLVDHTLDPYTLKKMALSIATGLSHLHNDISGTQEKPAIAHRDIKSRNILVKNDLSCAIADLGLAVRYDPITKSIDIPANSRVGTKRYLSPEILDDSIPMHHFEAFRCADIYALGLVFWELCRRCSLVAEEYQLPFFDVVAPDPTIEEMKKIVCDDKLRPPIPETWNVCSELSVLSRVMQECWYDSAPARLTSSRVKKTIALNGNERSNHSDCSIDVKA